MQPMSIMQDGIIPLHGIGWLAGAPSLAAIVMDMSVCAGMATADMPCIIVALKNATANRMANKRLRGWRDM
jgi:hypothetical protein